MSATPTYDAVVEDLKIDPERIAARPAWSFELAERVRKHRKKMMRSMASKQRTQQLPVDQPPAQRSRTKPAAKKTTAKQTRAGQSQTQRAATTKRAVTTKPAAGTKRAASAKRTTAAK